MFKKTKLALKLVPSSSSSSSSSRGYEPKSVSVAGEWIVSRSEKRKREDADFQPHQPEYSDHEEEDYELRLSESQEDNKALNEQKDKKKRARLISPPPPQPPIEEAGDDLEASSASMSHSISCAFNESHSEKDYDTISDMGISVIPPDFSKNVRILYDQQIENCVDEVHYSTFKRQLWNRLVPFLKSDFDVPSLEDLESLFYLVFLNTNGSVHMEQAHKTFLIVNKIDEEWMKKMRTRALEKKWIQEKTSRPKEGKTKSSTKLEDYKTYKLTTKGNQLLYNSHWFHPLVYHVYEDQKWVMRDFRGPLHDFGRHEFSNCKVPDVGGISRLHCLIFHFKHRASQKWCKVIVDACSFNGTGISIAVNAKGMDDSIPREEAHAFAEKYVVKKQAVNSIPEGLRSVMDYVEDVDEGKNKWQPVEEDVSPPLGQASVPPKQEHQKKKVVVNHEKFHIERKFAIVDDGIPIHVSIGLFAPKSFVFYFA